MHWKFRKNGFFMTKWQKTGIPFFTGNDKVWLCKEKPKEYLSALSG